MATDFFLDLGDIKGESKSTGFEDQIKIESFSWGASQHSTVSGTGGSSAGKASLADLNVMKTLDKASIPMLKALISGKHLPKATLSAAKSTGDTTGKPYLKVELTEVFVTGIQESGSSEVPMESVSFSYNQIKVTYSTQGDDGTLTVAGTLTYNTKTNLLS